MKYEILPHNRSAGGGWACCSSQLTLALTHDRSPRVFEQSTAQIYIMFVCFSNCYGYLA